MYNLAKWTNFISSESSSSSQSGFLRS